MAKHTKASSRSSTIAGGFPRRAPRHASGRRDLTPRRKLAGGPLRRGAGPGGNVATLARRGAGLFAMPDIHWGYGFCIGGVAATDLDQGGVVSPGGVGYDINCGVRSCGAICRQDVAARIKELVDQLFRICRWRGRRRPVPVLPRELRELMGRACRSWRIVAWRVPMTSRPRERRAAWRGRTPTRSPTTPCRAGPTSAARWAAATTSPRSSSWRRSTTRPRRPSWDWSPAM